MQESKGLKDLRVIIIDIDHVIHHYDAEYARQFSVATAKSFLELHPELAAWYDFDGLVEKAIQSYQKTGRTTAWFADRFKIDEMKLYRHHHDAMCEEGGYIAQQFKNGKIKADPELPNLLQQLKDIGVKIIFVTNGTQRYGEMVLGDRGHGIAHLADGIYGIDSVDNKHMNDKRNGAFITDILAKIGELKLFKNAIGAELEDFNHNHIGMIDDTNRNLRAPRLRFNMYTTLMVNNPQWRGVTYANDMIGSFTEFLGQVITAKKTVKSPQPLRLVGGTSLA